MSTPNLDGPVNTVQPPNILDTSAAGSAVIRGSVLRVLGHVANIGLSVISAALLTRFLGVDDFGRYTVVVSLVTLVSGLAEVGLVMIGVQEYSTSEGAARDRMMRSLLGIRITLTAIGILVATVFALVVQYDSVMVLGVILSSSALILGVIQSTYNIPLQSQLQLGWLTTLELIKQASTVALIVVVVLVGAGLLPLFAIPIPVGILLLAITLPLARGKMPLLPQLDYSQWKGLLRIALPYALAAAVGTLYIYMAVVLMSVVATEEQTGYFAPSFRIFIALSAIPGLLVTSAFPILARTADSDQDRLAYALQRLFDASLVLGVGIVIVTTIGAPLAIDIVAGKNFAPSEDVLRVQSLALLGSFFVAIWGFALLALRKYRALLVANAFGLAISALATITLAPSYGADGAAVATVAGETSLGLACGAMLMRSRRDLRVSLHLLPRVLLAAAPALAVVLIPGLAVLVYVVLAIFVYLGAVVLLKAIPQELWDELPWRQAPS